MYIFVNNERGRALVAKRSLCCCKDHKRFQNVEKLTLQWTITAELNNESIKERKQSNLPVHKSLRDSRLKRGGEGRSKTRQQENVTSSLIKLERIWIKVVDHVVEREREEGVERRWEQRVMPRRRRQWRAFMLAAEIETDNSNSSNNQLSCGSVRPSSGTRVLRNFPPWWMCEVEFGGSWGGGQGKLYTAVLEALLHYASDDANIRHNESRMKDFNQSFRRSLSLTSYNLFVSLNMRFV